MTGQNPLVGSSSLRNINGAGSNQEMYLSARGPDIRSEFIRAVEITTDHVNLDETLSPAGVNKYRLA